MGKSMLSSALRGPRFPVLLVILMGCLVCYYYSLNSPESDRQGTELGFTELHSFSRPGEPRRSHLNQPVAPAPPLDSGNHKPAAHDELNAQQNAEKPTVEKVNKYEPVESTLQQKIVGAIKDPVQAEKEAPQESSNAQDSSMPEWERKVSKEACSRLIVLCTFTNRMRITLFHNDAFWGLGVVCDNIVPCDRHLAYKSSELFWPSIMSG